MKKLFHLEERKQWEERMNEIEKQQRVWQLFIVDRIGLESQM